METASAWGDKIFNFVSSTANSLLGVFTGTFDIFKGFATNDKTKMLVIGAIILWIAGRIFKFSVKVGK